MTDTSKRRVWIDVAALLALAAALRGGYAIAVPRMLDSADSVHYLDAARTLAHGDFLALDPKIPVLFPLLTASVHLFFRDLEVSGQIVSFVFSSLLVVPVYFLSRALHGERVARTAGALVAVWPWLIDYSNRVATEPTAVFFWMLGALCVVRGLSGGSLAWMAGAGLSFAALHLARAEGTFVLLGALAASAIAGGSDWNRTARRLLVLASTATVVLVGHSIYMHALVGRWIVNYRVGFIGDQPEGSTVAADLAKTIVAMTGDVPAVMLGPLLWALFGIGLFARDDTRRNVGAEAFVLLLVIVQWLVVIPVLSPAPRYLMSSFVALSLWSARGVSAAGSVLGSAASRAWARWLPLALVLMWMALQLVAAIGRERAPHDIPTQPWEYKIAGEWMRAHLKPGIIVSRKPQVGFYAEMPTVGLAADAPVSQVVNDAAKSDARYLVVDERYTAQIVPATRALLDPANAPKGLRLIEARLSPYPRARIVIYEFIR